ncbi:MAG TPA: hypothetical protein DD671_12310 [Balneolaceae bacterium]|nr:hypothetical protein [Balneolaceae bacterium]
MKYKCKFKPGDRIAVWVTDRQDVYEGDSGTVIETIPPATKNSNVWLVTAILDTGIKLWACREGAFVHERNYDPDIPF